MTFRENAGYSEAEQRENPTKMSFHTEWKRVLQGSKACPAGSVPSHWQKDKVARAGGRQPWKGWAPFLLDPSVYSPRVLESQHWKAGRASSHSAPFIQQTMSQNVQRLRWEGDPGTNRDPPVIPLSLDGPGQIMEVQAWERFMLYPKAMGSH